MPGVSFYNLPAERVFSPSDLPNLDGWWKSDAGVTTVSNAVSVWADQSGNGKDWIQSNASNRPAYGSVQLNGIDVITADNIDDAMILSGSATVSINTTCTVYMVCNAITTTFDTLMGSNGSAVGFAYPRSRTLLQSQNFSPGTTTDWMGAWRVYTINANGTTYVPYEARVAKIGNNISSTYVVRTLFCRRFTGGLLNPTGGNVAEILIYNANHDASTKAQVWDYLEAKWAL